MAARAIPRRQHRVLTRAIERWRADGVVSAETAEVLRRSIVPAPFDWRRLAAYAFVIAVVCAVIAVTALVADRMLMDLLARLFSAPDAIKSLAFAGLAALVFAWALRRRRRAAERVYSNEAIFLVGVLALAAAVGFFGAAVDRGTGHFSVLFLLAAVLYLLLGLAFPSRQVWIFGLLSLGAWMGTETGYVSGWGAYYLGMNYPLRFVLFGAALGLLGLASERLAADPRAASLAARLRLMAPATKVMGYLNLFIALWIMSIFGNYGDMTRWERVRQYELFHWSLLFGAAAIAAIWYGLKRDDGVLRGFGLTFLFINLYTRFFEYFWNSIHKAAFFAVLAVSFWYVGSRAEAIWHFGERRPQPAPATGRG